jgi:hypothetical protein
MAGDFFQPPADLHGQIRKDELAAFTESLDFARANDQLIAIGEGTDLCTGIMKSPHDAVAPRPTHKRRWTWLSVAAGGGVLGALALLKRSREKTKRVKPEVGSVSDRWIAEHTADRES